MYFMQTFMRGYDLMNDLIPCHLCRRGHGCFPHVPPHVAPIHLRPSFFDSPLRIPRHSAHDDVHRFVEAFLISLPGLQRSWWGHLCWLIRSPDRPVRSQSLYRMSYRAHENKCKYNKKKTLSFALTFIPHLCFLPTGKYVLITTCR
jgi:hypothetical protein